MSETEGAAAPAAETPTVAERPEAIPEKFWDADAGAPRIEDLAKSYTALESAMGRRIQEVSADTRRIIAEALPENVRSDWETNLRGRLVEDPDFIAPLEEKWRATNLPKAPEAYEMPSREDGRVYDAESPLYVSVLEAAKKHGLGQEAFSELMDLTFQAHIDAEPPDLEQWKAAIPDIDGRAKAVYNRLLGVSPAHAKSLIDQVRDPNAFLALEALVKGSGPKSLALEAAHSEPDMTQDALDKMMLDPKYWRDHDSEVTKKVANGFKRLYGDFAMIAPEYFAQFSSEVSRLWREQAPARAAGVEIDLTLPMQEMHASQRIDALDPDPKAQAASAVEALYRKARYGTVDPHTLDAEGLRTLKDTPAHHRYCESGEPRIHTDDETLSASVMMGFG